MLLNTGKLIFISDAGLAFPSKTIEITVASVPTKWKNTDRDAVHELMKKET